VRRLKEQRGRPNYGLWNRTGSNSRGSVRHVFLGSNLPAVEFPNKGNPPGGRAGFIEGVRELRHFSTHEINFIVHDAAHQRKRQVVGLPNFEFILL
jgi:hypothetical protein